MKTYSRAFVILSLLVLSLFVGAGAKPAAAAGKPACWQVLLNDWYDGRIDGTYPIHCYQDALKHLPSDADIYSSARDDIQRALQSARAAAAKSGQKLTPNTLVRQASTTASKPPKKGGGVTIKPIGRKPPKGIAQIADQLDSGSPSSVPVPLLVLGGLALLLVALGGAGLLARRFQRRKPGH